MTAAIRSALLPTLLGGTLAMTASLQATATEGGAGHYITGAYAAPGAGIVPPAAGLYWSSTNLYYGASTSGALQFPVAGKLATGLRVDFASFSYTALYVPPLDLGSFTYAAAITLPGQYMDTEGSLGARSRSDTSGGLGDIMITPVAMGWHSGADFVQVRLDIFAPTADYKLGSLANIGMNYWTFTPTIAYTHLIPKLDLDLSANLGVDFNTRNEKTDYQSGNLMHLDLSATKTFGTTGFGVGLLGSVLYQISDDSGGLAARLDGFRGQAFSVGPILRYAIKVNRMEINSSLRWAPEFATKNRLAGNAVYLSFSGKF